ncbi:MAG TPA: LysR family transcriptional regulator [Anaeromyxobacteraceae bacterium]|nr:LysR family transcriptional regulator [Anaeromyxobacteraceae bacterium]
MSRVDPRKLETFRVVVQTRKISAAAKLLHLSQPAVTAQVRALEEECGRALLLRSTKGVTPTAWGLRLLEAAKQVHDLLGEVESAFQEEPTVDAEVVLAASMTTSAWVVPQLVAGYRALHGRVPFRLQVANTARVLEWIAEGRIPLAIVEGRLRSPRVQLERYLDDELVAVASSSVPELRAITRAADLAKVPLLLREPGSNTRAEVEAGLARVLGKKRMPQAELLFGSNQSIKMAAVAGLGVAFVSRWSVQLEIAAGMLRVLPLRDLHIVRTFSWATASRPLHGAAGRFLDWARRNPPVPP